MSEIPGGTHQSNPTNPNLPARFTRQTMNAFGQAFRETQSNPVNQASNHFPACALSRPIATQPNPPFPTRR